MCHSVEAHSFDNSIGGYSRYSLGILIYIKKIHYSTLLSLNIGGQ